MHSRLPLPFLRRLLRCFLLAAPTVSAAPVINEIMYRPGPGYPENIALEFIERDNPDTTAADLSGWAITQGAGYPFPAGTTSIALVELYDADPGTPTARLGHLATRGYVGTGTDIIAAGVVISGTGSRAVLVRAVGATLAGIGVTGALAEPQLALYRGTEGILANDDWSAGATAAATGATAAQLGAYALPAGSKDAAFVVSLPDRPPTTRHVLRDKPGPAGPTPPRPPP